MTVPAAFDDLASRPIDDFASIGSILDELVKAPLPPPSPHEPFLQRAARGSAFVTFAFDIDGVSMEIVKYGAALEELLVEAGYHPRIHCLGGTFGDKVDHVLDPGWERTVLSRADGWDKWDDGRWFSGLFESDMPEGGALSRALAQAMWFQAVELAREFADFLARRDIGLLIPVNTCSNPGNFALALALVLVTEVTGCPVLNNNHDFYWEGGSPASERAPDETPGPRDHFFRNATNAPFFALFQRLFPWNGRRWIQVNINPLQSTRLVEQEGFAADRVFLIGTSIEDAFFAPCPRAERRRLRHRMTRILADGYGIATPTPVARFAARTEEWMRNQTPVVCALSGAAPLDVAADDVLVLLQPTRVVGRKQIARNWDLIGALLAKGSPLAREFARRKSLRLVLHVTGPVPVEHGLYLEEVLESFVETASHLPPSIGRRMYQSFSVGHQGHRTLRKGLEIADIYRMSDMVLFPSETEGRGLPIPEAAAAGLPIVCRRYDPLPVFEEVVGEHGPDEERIRYVEFPAGDFDTDMLEELSAMLLDPSAFADRVRRNREAVRSRYTVRGLERSFLDYLFRLETILES